MIFDLITESQEKLDEFKSYANEDDNLNFIKYTQVLNQTDSSDQDNSVFKSLKQSTGIIYLSHSRLSKKSELDIIDKLIDRIDKAEHIKIIPLIILMVGEEFDDEQWTKIIKRLHKITERKVEKINLNYDWICENNIGIVTFAKSKYLVKYLKSANDMAIKKNIVLIKSHQHHVFDQIDTYYPENSDIRNHLEEIFSDSDLDSKTLNYFIKNNRGLNYCVKYFQNLPSKLDIELTENYENYYKMITILMTNKYFSEINSDNKKIFIIVLLFVLVNIDDTKEFLKSIINDNAVNKIFRKLICLVGFSKKNLLKMHQGKKIKYSEIGNHYPEFENLFSSYLFSDSSLYEIFIDLLYGSQDAKLNIMDDIEQNNNIEINFSSDSDNYDNDYDRSDEEVEDVDFIETNEGSSNLQNKIKRIPRLSKQRKQFNAKYQKTFENWEHEDMYQAYKCYLKGDYTDINLIMGYNLIYDEKEFFIVNKKDNVNNFSEFNYQYREYFSDADEDEITDAYNNNLLGEKAFTDFCKTNERDIVYDKEKFFRKADSTNPLIKKYKKFYPKASETELTEAVKWHAMGEDYFNDHCKEYDRAIGYNAKNYFSLIKSNSGNVKSSKDDSDSDSSTDSTDSSDDEKKSKNKEISKKSQSDKRLLSPYNQFVRQFKEQSIDTKDLFKRASLAWSEYKKGQKEWEAYLKENKLGNLTIKLDY